MSNLKAQLPTSILGALEPIDPPDLVPRSSTPTRLVPSLGFNIRTQEQSNWCWAAVGVSVSKFYDSCSKWTQCSLVDAELDCSCCCNEGSSKRCNKPWYLDRALRRTYNYHNWRSGSLSVEELIAELESGAPVAVRIGWKGGGGHFVCIDHCVTGDRQYIEVHDPWSGSATCEYIEFASNYKGMGKWTHTYLTKGV